MVEKKKGKGILAEYKYNIYASQHVNYSINNNSQWGM